MPSSIRVEFKDFPNGNSKFNCPTKTIFVNSKVTDQKLIQSLERLLRSILSGALLLRAHPAARFSASTTGIYTHLHHLVVVHLFATNCALLANCRADLASARMKIRLSQHKISRHGTDFRAVSHDSNMIWFCVGSALCETVLDHLFADLMAAQAIVDAFLHVFAHSTHQIL